MTGKWLSDLHVDASLLIMLMKKYFDVGGLQHPLLGQNISFKRVEGKIIQILHSTGYHCLTVSTVSSGESPNVA